MLLQKFTVCTQVCRTRIARIPRAFNTGLCIVGGSGAALRRTLEANVLHKWSLGHLLTGLGYLLLLLSFQELGLGFSELLFEILYYSLESLDFNEITCILIVFLGLLVLSVYKVGLGRGSG